MKNLLFVLPILLGACQQTALKDNGGSPSSKILPVASREGGEPNLFVSEHGQVVLSWVEYLNDSTDALMFSHLKGDRWGPPVEIARGSNWFVNWADFPSVAAFRENPTTLAAHWLQKSAAGTYDYDVRIALSKDDGQNWMPSFIPHQDGIAAEHGFVSMLPLDNGHMLGIWLDGRFTKGGAHGHGGGAMTLRTAEFDESGRLYEEAELDHRICDCCQTDAALTSAGPVVVYRDRSEEEIRDISVVRKVNGHWTRPQHPFEDQWKIAGCPVNGPAIAARDMAVAIAWFTAAEDQSQVKVAFSNDAGATFSPPIRVDDGLPIGRVDVVWIDPETALVSWIEAVEQGGEIRLAKVKPEGKIDQSISLTQIGVSRQSGFPILEKSKDSFLLAWTSVDSTSSVKTLSFDLK